MQAAKRKSEADSYCGLIARYTATRAVFARGEEVLARLQVVKPDEANDPLHRRALGMNRVMVETEGIPDFIEKFWLLTSC